MIIETNSEKETFELGKKIGENAKVGAAAVVVADVPSDVTVVGIPAKIVRVHGQKDAPTIKNLEEIREESYYSSKL